MVDLGSGRGWLNDDAAASLWRVDARIGHPLQITSAGRTRAEQQAAYDRYLAGTGSFAAFPGTSPHEFGNAIDTNERLVDILADHGWWRPLSFEPWHFVYRAWADNHINESAAGGSGTPSEDDMTPEESSMLRYVFNALSKPYGDQLTAIINVIRGEIAPQIASIAAGGILFPGQPYNGLVAIVNAVRAEQGQAGLDIDEAELAANLAPALAPLIAENLGTLTDQTVNDLVKRLLDEQAKRLAS